jgi:beta-glucosidase
MRAMFYGPWLELAKADDFVGVQNYARTVWTADGPLPAPKDAVLNTMGTEVYAPSLAGAVRYVHEATGRPVMVTEHGVGIEDDAVRSGFIPEALAALQAEIARGVPVLGYVHWTLADNFEWIFGYSHKFGLCSVDRGTFARTPKPSATVLGNIARHNAV